MPNAESTPDPTTDKPPRRKRWFPLSLQMFVVMLVIFGVWSGMSAYRRINAIREVKRLNGSVQWAHKRQPEWFFRWVGEDRMEWFDDPDHVVFWANTENIRKRSRFGGIIIVETGPQIDDAGLTCVLGLPNLKSLDLAFSSVSDAGVAQISHLRKLENLRLQGTDVSDLSIPILSKMRSLKELSVVDSRITKSGSRVLEEVLPGCDVQGPHNDQWP